MPDMGATNEGGESPNRSADDDDRLILEALKAMEQGFDHAAGLKPFGAVIVKEGMVVATGVNTCNRDRDPTAHAEVNAIRAAARQLDSPDLFGCILYASAQPCPMCRAAAFHAGIQSIIYASTWSDYQDLFPDQACHEAVNLSPDPSLQLAAFHHADTIKLWNQYRVMISNHAKEKTQS